MNKVMKMNSRKPIRMWIDGKCFNIKPFNLKPSQQSKHNTEEFNDDGLQNQIELFTNASGALSTRFRLPSYYYKKLQHFQGFDIKLLANRTNTNIVVPKSDQIAHVEITGGKQEHIEEAVKEIHSVVGKIRHQNMALQFISIPLINDEIKRNFEQFKSEVLGDKSIKGMEESIFQSPLKLHLTVNVFALLSEIEETEAINALQEYKTTVLKPLFDKIGPLKVRVAGLDYMDKNPKKVDVLFANVSIVDETEEKSLQKIVNDISDYFYERGLNKSYQENVKLHLTLINTKYRKSKNSPKRGPWVKRQSIDATNIMEKHKDYVFGDCNLDTIHLSYISSKGEDGFYKPLSIIKLI